MKRFLLSIVCLFSCAQSNGAAFSPARITSFYEQYICQTKLLLSTTGLTTPCITNNLEAPPPNPSAPPFMDDLLPIVFVNNSGLPDNQVYILITGRAENDANSQYFTSFDSSGVGTLVIAAFGDNGSNYSTSLASLPSYAAFSTSTQKGYVAYIPKIAGGLIWYSLNNKLSMPVVCTDPASCTDAYCCNHTGIQQPDFLNPLDVNYNTIFDIGELAYVSNPIQIVADATAVSFFSIPVYGYISTPAPGTSPNTGLFANRSTIFNNYADAVTTYAFPPADTEWNKLVLRDNTGRILRLLSPGKSMVLSNGPNPSLGFDPNYLDNVSQYGYSFINDIWTDPNSFYRRNPLTLQIPNGTTYIGTINPDNTITFASVIDMDHPVSYQVVLSAPTTTLPYSNTTTWDIFSGIFFIQSDNSPGMADGPQINKLLEEAIIAGLLPTTSTVSNDYFTTSGTASYYQVNPYLSLTGQNSGPWYDLYSKVLHDQGFIYTYAYDEPLWPYVQILSTNFEPNATYLAFTIGNVVTV